MKTEQARHIASNPDGCDRSELIELAQYIGNGVRPMQQAAAIWPNEVIESIPGYRPNEPIGRLYVCKAIRNYCWNKATAMGLRSSGRVQQAIVYERICERIYGNLPAWARW